MSSRHRKRFTKQFSKIDLTPEQPSGGEFLQSDASTFKGVKVEENEATLEEDEEIPTQATARKKKSRCRRAKKTCQQEWSDLEIEAQSTTPAVVEAEPQIFSHVTEDKLMKVKMEKLDYRVEDAKMIGTRRKHYERKSFAFRNMLVPHREVWAGLASPGISMQTCANFDGITGQYKFSPSYQQLNTVFYELCKDGDEKLLLAILVKNPYHLESLLRLGFVFRQRHEDPSAYHEFIERALFIFESCKDTNARFNDNKLRLSYEVYENRIFHLCLFIHVLNQEDRCCYEVCHQLCKLLLNLDNRDPLGVLCVYDFYCLKNKHYRHLIEFYNKYKSRLSMMPNMRFSVAIAYYFQTHVENYAFTMAGALFDFPEVLQEITIQVSSNRFPDTILDHPLFRSGARASTPPVTTMVAMYVQKMKFMLSDSQIFKLFLDAAKKCIEIYENRPSLMPKPHAPPFPSYPKPLLRHVFLTQFSEAGVNAELAKLDHQILITDPFPPSQSPNPYVSETSTEHPEVMTECRIR